jgi:hypothetical protein
MQADVDEVGGDLERRFAAGELVEAERGVVLREHLEQRRASEGSERARNAGFWKHLRATCAKMFLALS